MDLVYWILWLSEQQEEQGQEQEPQQQEQPAMRRSSRQAVPRVPMNIQSTQGQAYFTSGQIPEIEYDKDLAKVAVNFMMNIKEKGLQTSTRKKGDVFLTTYSFKKGIQKFKQAGFDLATEEMQQLHDSECWDVVDPANLKETKTKKALELLIFLVEKKSGIIKSRHCANGSKQRNWMDDGEVSSPTRKRNRQRGDQPGYLTARETLECMPVNLWEAHQRRF